MAFVEFLKGKYWPDEYSVVGPRHSWSVVKNILKGGLSDNLETLEINSGKFKFSIFIDNISNRNIHNFLLLINNNILLNQFYK